MMGFDTCEKEDGFRVCAFAVRVLIVLLFAHHAPASAKERKHKRNKRSPCATRSRGRTEIY